MNGLHEFIAYVWEFYNPNDGIYPIKGLHPQDILDAIDVYQDRIIEAESNNGRWFNVTYIWGDGDSLDRERVRDIILEKPQFVWSS